MANPTAPSQPAKTLSILFALLSASCSLLRPPSSAYDGARQAFVEGDLNAAIRQASAGVARYGADPHSAWGWRFRLLEAEALSVQSRTTEAEALLHTPVPAGADLSQLEVRRLVDRTSVVAARERPVLLAQARAAATDPELQIRIKVLEGAVLLTTSPDAGQTQFREALAMAERAGSLYWQASTLTNLSYSSKLRHRYEESVGFARRAVTAAESVKARRLVALAHVNLGSAYYFLGETDAALEQQEQAIQYLDSSGDRSNLLIALGEIGLVHDARDERPEAIESHRRAYLLARELNRNVDAERNAGNLALAFIKEQNWEQAEEWNQKALDLVPKTAGKVSAPYLTRNRARIIYARGQAEEAMAICAQLLRDTATNPNLQWEVYALMGVMDAEAKRFPKANSEFEKALKIIDENRAELSDSQFRITLLSHLIPFYQDYVDALVQQKNYASAIRIAESSRARVLSELLQRDQKPDRFPDVNRLRAVARSTHSTLLSFWLAPLRSYAWLITADAVRPFQLPPSGEIEKLVTEYRKVLEHPLSDPILANDSSGPNLWNALMREIGPAIPQGTHLIVIPDGALHRLNLETLVAPSPHPHYWIEDVEIAVAPSLAIAASNPALKGARKRSLLLIGAPEYAGSGFDPLKNVDKEVAEIEARFPNTSRMVLTGGKAVPAAYKDSNPAGFSNIHFAAHAEANFQNPLESAVILSGQGSQNRLYARDVIDTSIHADLVTISACSSAGVRSYAGEGLIGFVWAFLRAGAGSVVAGLWDVSDTSTEPLMDRFYAAMEAGQNPISALHGAKLALRRDEPRFAKPFYWAPFQTYIASAATGSEKQKSGAVLREQPLERRLAIAAP